MAPPRRYQRTAPAPPATSERGLPHDWNLEAAVLGTVIAAPEVLPDVRAVLAADAFHRPAHEHLYELLCRLADAGEPPSFPVVLGTVEAEDLAERLGGLAYLSTMTQRAPAEGPTYVANYARRLAALHARRRLLLAARAIEADVQSGADVGRYLEALGIHQPGHGDALGWLAAGPDWLAEEPAQRAYLLHDAWPEQVDAMRKGHPIPGFLADGMLPRGKVGILAAAGGVGKTFALCGLALSLATGRPWFERFPVGRDVRGRVALVLGEEDAEEARRRLFTQARAMGIRPPEGRGLPWHEAEALAGIRVLPGAALRGGLALVDVNPDTGRTEATPRARELRAFLAGTADAGGFGWDAILFDPLSRLAGPDAETDNAAATRLIEQLEAFTTLPGRPAVIVAHHVRKPSDDAEPRLSAPRSSAGVRGSSALVDGARWVARLEPGPGRLVTFGVTKSNYAPFPTLHKDHGLVLYKPQGGGLRLATDAEIREEAPDAIGGTTSTKGGKGARDRHGDGRPDEVPGATKVTL
jgi:hypothetical protein